MRAMRRLVMRFGRRMWGMMLSRLRKLLCQCS